MVDDQTTKKCPFCAETIQAEAIKCRYCQTSLDPATPGIEPENVKEPAVATLNPATVGRAAIWVTAAVAFAIYMLFNWSDGKQGTRQPRTSAQAQTSASPTTRVTSPSKSRTVATTTTPSRPPCPNFIDPYEGIRVGATYYLPKRTPLVPHYDPPDPAAAISQIRYVEGINVKILRKHRPTPNSLPWYEVKTAADQAWISGAALAGQCVEEVAGGL